MHPNFTTTCFSPVAPIEKQVGCTYFNTTTSFMGIWLGNYWAYMKRVDYPITKLLINDFDGDITSITATSDTQVQISLSDQVIYIQPNISIIQTDNKTVIIEFKEPFTGNISYHTHKK
jgi:hypothetical protein